MNGHKGTVVVIGVGVRHVLGQRTTKHWVYVRGPAVGPALSGAATAD